MTKGSPQKDKYLTLIKDEERLGKDGSRGSDTTDSLSREGDEYTVLQSDKPHDGNNEGGASELGVAVMNVGENMLSLRQDPRNLQSLRYGMNTVSSLAKNMGSNSDNTRTIQNTRYNAVLGFPVHNGI